jgi:hypothetical protein
MVIPWQKPKAKNQTKPNQTKTKKKKKKKKKKKTKTKTKPHNTQDTTHRLYETQEEGRPHQSVNATVLLRRGKK